MKDLIKAWSVSDTSQTTKSEATYLDLRLHTDSSIFQLRLNELDDYLIYHPSKRLEARIIMYRIKGEHELSKPTTIEDRKQIEHAIIFAGLLNDRQLLSELYYLYAEFGLAVEYGGYNIEDELFYELKAIDIQQRIGFNHFPLAHIRFLLASQLFYTVRNYKKSIHYGLGCLSLLQSPKSNLTNYILELDNIGACYRILGMADSTIFYYQQIQQILRDYTQNPAKYTYSYKFDKFFQTLDNINYIKIWMGISAGGIAQGLFLQKKYDEAYPLLLQNVQSSVETKQFGDASLAQNTLAQINSIHKQYDSAIYRWQLAYQWAVHDNELQSTINALYNLANTYKTLGNYDSAYIYINKYHIYNDTLQQQISNSRFATINTRIKYDNMQTTLQDAQANINWQIRLRNYLIIAVILFIVIITLLYNRYRLKQHFRQERLKKEKELAEIEVMHAKLQMETFVHNISEKNRLIETLQARFNAAANDDTNTMLRNFTILTENDWVIFKASFEKANPGFWQRLSNKLPGLTQAEQRIIALMRLGLNTKEMAAATGVSPETIRSVLSRMRKKLNILSTTELHTIIAEI